MDNYSSLSQFIPAGRAVKAGARIKFVPRMVADAGAAKVIAGRSIVGIVGSNCKWAAGRDICAHTISSSIIQSSSIVMINIKYSKYENNNFLVNVNK